MSELVRLSIRLDPSLKQALIDHSTTTGIPISRLVSSAVAQYLQNPLEDPASPSALTELTQRVETLEQLVQTLLASSPQPTAQPTPAAPSESESGDPNLWDPVQASFEDWVFQIWMKIATQLQGSEDCWGQSVPVEEIHQLAFYTMRPRRFTDRLVTAEAPGLTLITDENSVDCRPVALTYYWELPSLEPSSQDPSSKNHHQEI